MRGWKQVAVPSLARFGPAPTVTVHDTSTGTLVPTPVPAGPAGTARLYVCGITPYDATHLGHAATYLAFDLLNRAWRDAGHAVRYVQNVTDVDDPLLERAERDDEDWRELADREIQRFRGDMEALRMIAPDHYVGAVESIPLIVRMLEELQVLGLAYRVEDDWYFPVHADPGFGAVSGLSEPEMLAVFAERGGDPERPGKRHPLDCLLWQGQRPGEPGWDSSFGTGRPGWHAECSAIALSLLGERFDVQGGGSDLAFPHHEMSASQAQAARPELRFAEAYVHAGMVGYQGQKMSKSRGNLVFVSELRTSGVDPRLIRVALLGHHYRSDWEWTDQELPAAEKRLSGWQAALEVTATDRAERLVHDLRRALAHDLDGPTALALLDQWAEESGVADGDGSGASTVRELLDARLGLLLQPAPTG